MKTYIVRFEILHGTDKDYLLLKKLLTDAHFSKNILGKDGVYYILPKGDYLIKSERTKKEVFSLASSVIKEIGKEHYILVVEAADKGFEWRLRKA